jgi:enterochelin esterase-like enzyme
MPNPTRRLLCASLASAFCLPLAHAALPAAQSPSASPLPRASTGTIERIRIASATVDERPVDVWLPEDYAPRARAGHRYQVLYMQDGQMLFDPTTTWNRQAWRVDEILGRLIREGRVPDTIVVGVWNNGKYRASEYFPQKFLDHMAPAVRDAYVGQALEGRARADDYLRYLVTQVKPAIDKRYATRSDAAGTFIMGSSMGGLISVYAFTEYPQVFGGAAGLSTHWVGSFAPNASIPLAAFNYLSRTLPAPEGRRLYLDRGTATLDALYGPAQAFVDQIVRERGYGVSDYESRVFEGAEHSERAWSERLEIPMLFLLKQR